VTLEQVLPLAFWGAIVALLGYETYTIWTARPDDSISALVWQAVTARPILPFLAGLLAGHFFWRG
jgi:hypothetical protein